MTDQITTAEALAALREEIHTANLLTALTIVQRHDPFAARRLESTLMERLGLVSITWYIRRPGANND